MKSKFLLLVLLSVTVCFNACNKEDEPQEQTEAIPLVKTIVTTGNYEDSAYYSYDATGRVTKESHTMGYIIKYTYIPSKITVDTYWGKSTPDLTQSFRINSKGVATSVEKGGFLYTFKYDSLGYKLTTMFSIDTIDYARIKDGNTIRKKEFYLRDKYSSTTWDYQFSDHKNTIGNENMGITWNGRQNKNLVSKETKLYAVRGAQVETVTEYTYEYDTKDRVIKRTTILNGTLYLTESFTYY